MEPEGPEGNGGGQLAPKGRGAGLVERARAQGVALKERAEAETEVES